MKRSASTCKRGVTQRSVSAVSQAWAEGWEISVGTGVRLGAAAQGQDAAGPNAGMLEQIAQTQLALAAGLPAFHINTFIGRNTPCLHLEPPRHEVTRIERITACGLIVFRSSAHAHRCVVVDTLAIERGHSPRSFIRSTSCPQGVLQKSWRWPSDCMFEPASEHRCTVRGHKETKRERECASRAGEGTRQQQTHLQ